MALSTNRILEWDSDHHVISFPGLLPDISWAFTSSREPGYTKSGIWGRFMGLTGLHYKYIYIYIYHIHILTIIKVDSTFEIIIHIIDSGASLHAALFSYIFRFLLILISILIILMKSQDGAKERTMKLVMCREFLMTRWQPFGILSWNHRLCDKPLRTNRSAYRYR
jgi:hypothetical protein